MIPYDGTQEPRRDLDDILQEGKHSDGQHAPVSNQPLVSVITATYNAAKTLHACMQSVSSQDYPNLEHIIVDGASRDATGSIVQEWASERVRWISETDSGIYDAWNKGLSLARGEWIAFLGADDIYLPGAITSLMAHAQRHPGAMYISGQVRWIGPHGKPRIIGQPWQWARFRRFMCTAHVGSMHRRSLFEKYGKFDTSYRMVADYEFLLRARDRLHADFLPTVVAEMQCGGATDSVAALDEAARAKSQTGGRSPAAVRFERWLAGLAFKMRHQHSSKLSTT